MSDTDTENPPFDFDKSRAQRTGDPVSSEAAKLRRALREIAETDDIDAAHSLARRALER